MSSKDVNQVAAGIHGAIADVKRAGQAVVDRVGKARDETLDKFHRIETGICKDWEEANSALDDFINQSTNGPEDAANQPGRDEDKPADGSPA